jgi:hypothetical protein
MKMTTQLAALVGLGVIAGCSHVQRTNLPDGRSGFVIRCNGLAGKWYQCIGLAGRQCGSRGYDTQYNDDALGILLIACKSMPSSPPAP